MNPRGSTIFRRIYILVFFLITVLGLLFVGITWLATTHFFQASTELLNKDVAGHIAKFTSPYDGRGLDRQKADSVFQSAMVISPSAEVYFLDTTGKVVYFHGADSEIRTWTLPMGNIEKYIATQGREYMTGPDPRDPANAKIFSAAAVEGRGGKLGYIYVILGSRQYRNTTQMLYDSQISWLIIGAFVFIIAVSLLISLFYVDRLQRRFNLVLGVLERFQQGDFSARFATDGKDDMAPVTQSFNKMADLLLFNIDRLTHSEKERKDFMINISHDLRTPLAIARGYAETLLLQQKDLVNPNEREQYLQLVTSKIRQVENMVRQLFELSQMESASFEAKKEPFLFSEILQEVIQSVKLIASEKGVALDCHHCMDGSWVSADIRMMERVVQNLLINAVTYSPTNGHIYIALIREGGELIFRVDNAGEAFPPDLLEWINDCSEAGAARPSRPAIGLAIVKKILQLHRFPLRAEVVNCSAQAGEVAGRDGEASGRAAIISLSFRMPVYEPAAPGSRPPEVL